MKRPLCPLCGIELQHEYLTEALESGVTVTRQQEKHVQIWIHNPRYIHEDIQVSVHEECYKKVKAAYPNLDYPTQNDWANPRIPTIGKDGRISLTNIQLAVG